ncbi:MAG: DUF4114 domain-containing protein [Candidatus Rokubacteria bacterium]|nr:DUF4114 domain-containing protein [Candidatus Rokubacteria bacterium]
MGSNGYKKPGIAVVAALSLLLFLWAGPATAVPMLGGTVEYTGGDVDIEVILAAAAFHNFLDIYDEFGTKLIELAIENHGDLGPTMETVLAATWAGAGILPGDEAVFGIFVLDTGHTFLTGPGSRNPDGIEHAIVDDLGGGIVIVGFEDLFGGGDLDFDDTVFRFEGGVQAAVPAPASALLLGLALGGLGAWSRTRRPRA